MKGKRALVWLALSAVLLLSGCSMQTIDGLYCIPKRPESNLGLQTVIDDALINMDYCAPLSGDNRQSVQQADLDGDGEDEYLVFAAAHGEDPLRILIFQSSGDGYVLVDTLQCTGTAFDKVEYVQLDGEGGVELALGYQLSDHVQRTLGVYSFSQKSLRRLASIRYTDYLSCDLDQDSLAEIMVLRPGEENKNGAAILYSMDNGSIVSSGQVSMSEPVDNLKRIITGNLMGGVPAIFVGSSVEHSAIITDIYAVTDGVFRNISLSSESGTSVQTLRSHYVYADDIDDDGVVELPALITMQQPVPQHSTGEQYLIRWFAMNRDGTEVDKMYTYHNFSGGWYLKLGDSWAPQISVVPDGNAFDFYLWDSEKAKTQKIFTVFAFTGSSREDLVLMDNRFEIYRTESVIYAAHMEVASGSIDLSQEDLINGFRLIQSDWKTGET